MSSFVAGLHSWMGECMITAVSQVSLPVSRPTGRALLVSNPSARAAVRETLVRLGFGCAEADDPYAAMAELCRRPLVYRAVILSLAGLYREELSIISAIKRRYPHIELWLAHTDGRQSSLAEAMRLGADGLLDDDGLHRVAIQSAVQMDVQEPVVEPTGGREMETRLIDGTLEDRSNGEPILSADELKALLQEEPVPPPEAESQ